MVSGTWQTNANQSESTNRKEKFLRSWRRGCCKFRDQKLPKSIVQGVFVEVNQCTCWCWVFSFSRYIFQFLHHLACSCAAISLSRSPRQICRPAPVWHVFLLRQNAPCPCLPAPACDPPGQLPIAQQVEWLCGRTLVAPGNPCLSTSYWGLA